MPFASYSVERKGLDDIQRINMNCHKSRVLREKLAFACDVDENMSSERGGPSADGPDP